MAGGPRDCRKYHHRTPKDVIKKVLLHSCNMLRELRCFAIELMAPEFRLRLIKQQT